ncbi:hypothetical protein [Heliorestis convoluta]|uniref:Uncharacterized protein n=1 Tax=Heliorestis convoluta TaxID=356322 RepID=A0A5Q2N3B7_9FIRM|nr:hypothetical protein [Heliorestis convoluta]QGG48363.1 hypothetical protein FTV88_2265 [Heliorestis convoluta]
MTRFITGLIIGSFLGGAGIFVVTGSDLVQGGKAVAQAVQATVSIVAEHVDEETMKTIQQEVQAKVLDSITKNE